MPGYKESSVDTVERDISDGANEVNLVAINPTLEVGFLTSHPLSQMQDLQLDFVSVIVEYLPVRVPGDGNNQRIENKQNTSCRRTHTNDKTGGEIRSSKSPEYTDLTLFERDSITES